MKRTKLGNAEAGTQFVQGGNQAQTFILIVLVFIIIFYVISNIPKLFDFILQNRNTNNNSNNTNNANVTPTITPSNPNGNGGTNNNAENAELPSSTFEKYKVLQRLLNATGSNLVVDGLYGTGTNNALVSWSNRTGKGKVGTTSLEEWIRLLRTATQKTGLNGICSKVDFIKLINILKPPMVYDFEKPREQFEEVFAIKKAVIY